MTIALPGNSGAAQVIQQQQQMAMMLQNMRLQVACGVYSGLVSHEYARAHAEGKKAADPLGVNDPTQYTIQVDVQLPAKIAAASADALLVAMGILSPANKDE